MHDEARESVTEFYPKRSGTIGGLAFFLIMAALPAMLVFDSTAGIGLRVLGGFSMLLFGIGVLAMAHELIRPQPTLVITEAGFTYLGYPHVAWHEVERLRLRVARLRTGGHEERFAEVLMRDPDDYRSRVMALGDARAKQAADRPLYLLPARLPIPMAEVVAAMVHHHPGLNVGSGDEQSEHVAVVPRSADRDMVESALISALTEELPDGWQLAVLWFSLVGEDGHAGIQLQLGDESVDDLKPSEEVLALVNRLKEVCYDQMTGTWLSGQVAIKLGEERAQFKLSFQDVPEWLPVPDAEECRRELAAYPRAGDEIPEWLRQRIS
ncbi:hypothetical protein AB0N05_02195 [Nocardia sp. NPDC051030]|uniref:hypothetical protein n=1 Tax=Nocardia sp. NPDC051030 TaxID=3155162 RepID=UPI00342E5D6A